MNGLRGWLMSGTLALIAFVSWPTPANAASDSPESGDSVDELAAELPFLPNELLHVFHEERKKVEDLGITFRVHEDSEVWAKITGPGQQSFSYNGLTTGKIDIDLEKLMEWEGAEFYVSAFDIHGHGPSRSFADNQQLISNIEATPSVKLYDLWLEQSFFERNLSIRFGQEGANDEMMTTTYAGLFINSSFGFPGMPASDLPSGGPNYPMATPFARVQWTATDNITLVGAVFNGDPAPPGTGDPQVRDRNGTAFRLDDHTLSFGEIWFSPSTEASDKLPTTYKIGTWYSTSHFADQRFDSAGGLLASPASTGSPLNHDGDWAIYGIVDQRVWQNPDSKDRGIGIFGQLMGGPGDRNLSNLFIEGGINWLGPFHSRPDDTFGLAFSYLGISPAARAFSRDLVAFARATSSYASNETVIEATYQAPVTNWLTLQPDLQYVINPNVGVPNNFGSRALPNALVVGLRFTIRL
jgi:porin